MDEAVSAADANRRFSELLRKVRNGKRVVVTSHGKAVARIVPITDDDQTMHEARKALLEQTRRYEIEREIGRGGTLGDGVKPTGFLCGGGQVAWDPIHVLDRVPTITAPIGPMVPAPGAHRSAGR